jgi:hypothetical protein
MESPVWRRPGLESGEFVWPPIVDGGMILTPAAIAGIDHGMTERGPEMLFGRS